jgi:hypothetical protein
MPMQISEPLMNTADFYLKKLAGLPLSNSYL